MAFDNQAYLAAKLRQLNRQERGVERYGHKAGTPWDMGQLKGALQQEGWSPQQHYQKFGQYENLAYRGTPSPAQPYAPPYGMGESAKPEDVQKKALGAATDILEKTISRPRDYPADISGQMPGPAQAPYYERVQRTPMQTYSGLMGGDYQKLEQALQAPIQRAGEKQQARIGDIYGGRGLYGSAGGGLMSAAMAESQGATQDALSNAIANRYALQLKDEGLLMGQARAQFAANQALADAEERYRQGALGYGLQQSQTDIDFRNQMLQRAQQYQLQRDLWQQGADQTAFERALALAGLGTSGAGLQTQRDIAAQQAKAAQQGSMWQGLGGLAGGLMGSYGGKSGWTFGGLASDIGDVGSKIGDWLF